MESRNSGGVCEAVTTFRWELKQKSCVVFIIYLSSALTQHSVYEGHNGCFQVDLISVSPRVSVQIVNEGLWDDRPGGGKYLYADLTVRRCVKPPRFLPTHLEPCPLASKALVVQHGLQDLAVPAGHQADGAHDLQHGHLGFDVLRGQALGDDVDALGVGEDVGAALRVVHQGFDAADQGRVDLGFGGLVVHGLQEVQDARQAIQVDESSHEPATKSRQTALFRKKKLFTYSQ